MPLINGLLTVPPWVIPSDATDEVAMLQVLIDPGDPINYACFALVRPLSPPGFTKRVLFQMADLDQLVAHISTPSTVPRTRSYPYVPHHSRPTTSPIRRSRLCMQVSSSRCWREKVTGVPG
ncbi:MAG: hypothetical protein M1517_07800 [Deltaproteobacteria bacterium]|nr:hypothetical protein [Deltaproteobacteria bacterium]